MSNFRYYVMEHKSISSNVKHHLLKLEDVFTYCLPRKDIYQISECRQKLANLVQKQRKLFELNRTEKSKILMLLCQASVTIFNKMTPHFKLNELNDHIDHPLITDHAFCMAIARSGIDLSALKYQAYETAKAKNLTPIYAKDGKIMTFIKKP